MPFGVRNLKGDWPAAIGIFSEPSSIVKSDLLVGIFSDGLALSLMESSSPHLMSHFTFFVGRSLGTCGTVHTAMAGFRALLRAIPTVVATFALVASKVAAAPPSVPPVWFWLLVVVALLSGSLTEINTLLFTCKDDGCCSVAVVVVVLGVCS